MARSRQPRNPFYILLVLVGVAFTITACAYGVMALSALRPAAGANGAPVDHPLLVLLDRYGAQIMLAELALLALVTAGAMLTDHLWFRRSERDRLYLAPDTPPPPDETL